MDAWPWSPMPACWPTVRLEEPGFSATDDEHAHRAVGEAHRQVLQRIALRDGPAVRLRGARVARSPCVRRRVRDRGGRSCPSRTRQLQQRAPRRPLAICRACPNRSRQQTTCNTDSSPRRRSPRRSKRAGQLGAALGATQRRRTATNRAITCRRRSSARGPARQALHDQQASRRRSGPRTQQRRRARPAPARQAPPVPYAGTTTAASIVSAPRRTRPGSTLRGRRRSHRTCAAKHRSVRLHARR